MIDDNPRISTKTMLDLCAKYNTNEKYKGFLIGAKVSYKRDGKLSSKQFFTLKKVFSELGL